MSEAFEGLTDYEQHVACRALEVLHPLSLVAIEGLARDNASRVAVHIALLTLLEQVRLRDPVDLRAVEKVMPHLAHVGRL
ncbi:MAG: hypothetical protein SFW67_28565 [Myxococcaceae bacterium]|nr:hypothetical protein [Myxococcaceae bacterium]